MRTALGEVLPESIIRRLANDIMEGRIEGRIRNEKEEDYTRRLVEYTIGYTYCWYDPNRMEFVWNKNARLDLRTGGYIFVGEYFNGKLNTQIAYYTDVVNKRLSAANNGLIIQKVRF